MTDTDIRYQAWTIESVKSHARKSRELRLLQRRAYLTHPTACMRMVGASHCALMKQRSHAVLQNSSECHEIETAHGHFASPRIRRQPLSCVSRHVKADSPFSGSARIIGVHQASPRGPNINNMYRIGTTLLLMLATAHAEQVRQPVADILVTAFHDKQWEVRYELDNATNELVFARTPDESRRETWLPDHGFEIVMTSQGEAVRRVDGAPFTTVRIRMSPEYRHLRNDYAPFSPFGGGGTLFHTGRFFACTQACTGDATWSFTLWADPEDSIVLDGKYIPYSTRWADTGSGRMVYVGKNKQPRAADVTAIIDEAMPESVRGPLLSDLPALIRDFADRFGRLEEPLILFASYDSAHKQGWGRQGGTLPNQIFTHFYGAEWERRMQEPGFAFDLAWHFAHEAAHLYQLQRFSTEAGDPWIHEGAAEAFAALELHARNEAASQAVAHKLDLARTACAQDLGDRSMDEVLLGRDLSAAYSCGLLLNIYIDTKVRERTPDGLFAVWREYLRRIAGNAPRTRNVYLDSIAHVGGAELANKIRALLDAAHPNFELH